MHLLSQQEPHMQVPVPVQEELDLKEESEDEMPLMERSIMHQETNRSPPKMHIPAVTKLTSQQQMQLQMMRQGDEKVTDIHLERIKGILDRTGGWERLATFTKNTSLVRLHRKTSSPSSALFNKIKVSPVVRWFYLHSTKRKSNFFFFLSTCSYKNQT